MTEWQEKTIKLAKEASLDETNIDSFSEAMDEILIQIRIRLADAIKYETEDIIITKDKWLSFEKDVFGTQNGKV